MKRALVTGGSGFLGRHLRASLSAQQFEVSSAGRDSVEQIADWKSWRVLLQASKPEAIFHLLGTTDSSDETMLDAAHLQPTRGLLEAALALGLGSVPIFLLGSAAEYGNVLVERQPISEDEPARPVSAYGRSKLRATEVGLEFARRGLSVRVVRLFNVFGLGMSAQTMPGSVLSQLENRATKIQTHELKRVRDFLSVDVAMEALAQLASKEIPPSTILNLCSGEGFNLRDIVDSILSAAGRSEDLVVRPTDSGRSEGVINSVGNPDRLARLLGFRPKAPTLQDFARLVA